MSQRAIPRAESGERLLVLSELAHELTHYVLLMREHGWAFSRTIFNTARHGHSDPAFQRRSEHISAIIWPAYHSDSFTRAVAQMVQKASWETGQILTMPGRY